MLAGTAGGWALGLRFRGAAVTALAIVGGLLCLAGVWTYQRRTWSPILLLGLSFTIGLFVTRLTAVGDGSSAWPKLLITAAVMTASALAGRWLSRALRPVFGVTWVGAWVVVLAALGLQVAGAPSGWVQSCAKAIVAVFVFLSSAWFARLGEPPHPLAALDLYLIGTTLFLSMTLLRVTG